MSIFPRFCSENSFLDAVMTANPLIKGKEAHYLMINRINQVEMQSMKGLLVFNYIFLHLLFCMLLQLDMVQQNRWKSMEEMSYKKVEWIISAMLYLSMDTVLMLFSMIQTNRLLKYLKEI